MNQFTTFLKQIETPERQIYIFCSLLPTRLEQSPSQLIQTCLTKTPTPSQSPHQVLSRTIHMEFPPKANNSQKLSPKPKDPKQILKAHQAPSLTTLTAWPLPQTVDLQTAATKIIT